MLVNLEQYVSLAKELLHHTTFQEKKKKKYHTDGEITFPKMANTCRKRRPAANSDFELNTHLDT